MEEDFQVDVTHETRATVVTVTGELDVASSRSLEHELDRLGDVELMVIDLRKLSFIDSTGLGVLVRAHQRAAERQRRFALLPGTGQVERLLNLTGLDDQLTLADSVEQLLSGS